jgi:hypothetical protein
MLNMNTNLPDKKLLKDTPRNCRSSMRWRESS